MRLIGRILLWLIVGVVGLIALIALSIPFDGLIGQGRVAALTNTTIPGTGVEVRAYVARPDAPGTYPAVIMIHEWWGLREEIIGKAEALADEGYVVIAPDTFRGSSTSWIPRAIYQVSTSDIAQVRSDLDAVYAWLLTQPDVQTDKIAVMGFCYGGRTSLLYSIHNPQIAATGIFYGMADVTTAELQGLRGPVLGIFGGADTSIPLAEVQALEANLASAGVTKQFSVYDGQPHAFVTSIEAIRQGGPQQEAWNELLGFLAANLKGAAPSSGKGVPVDAPNATTFGGMLHHRFVCQIAS